MQSQRLSERRLQLHRIAERRWAATVTRWMIAGIIVLTVLLGSPGRVAAGEPLGGQVNHDLKQQWDRSVSDAELDWDFSADRLVERWQALQRACPEAHLPDLDPRSFLAPRPGPNGQVSPPPTEAEVKRRDAAVAKSLDALAKAEADANAPEQTKLHRDRQQTLDRARQDLKTLDARRDTLISNKRPVPKSLTASIEAAEAAVAAAQRALDGTAAELRQARDEAQADYSRVIDDYARTAEAYVTWLDASRKLMEEFAASLPTPGTVCPPGGGLAPPSIPEEINERVPDGQGGEEASTPDAEPGAIEPTDEPINEDSSTAPDPAGTDTTTASGEGRVDSNPSETGPPVAADAGHNPADEREHPPADEPAAEPSGQIDSDGDGLSDTDELNGYGTDPYRADTDSDGASDYEELAVSLTDPLDPTDSPWSTGEAVG